LEIAYVFHGWILFLLQQEQRYPALLLRGVKNPLRLQDTDLLAVVDG
jgi:hypothetical protein